MKNTFFLLLAIAFLTRCSPDRNIPSLSKAELEQLKEFQLLNKQNQIQIAGEDETGDKLWLCLTFVTKEEEKPLQNGKIKLYHTSAEGKYEPSDPNDESTARLNGAGFTDEEGRIFVQTILPGDYGSSTDNRHIHTTVKGAKPVAYDIHFKQYTAQMGKSFISGSDQHFLADLRQNEDSILIAFLTIEVKGAQNTEVSLSQKKPDCQWCGASEAPTNISWETEIASAEEPGERLILEGTIFERDGKTPAEGVTIYAYHTNAKGIYEKTGNETGNGLRHGKLRGWVKTNSEGKYKFSTIKPAPYPSNAEPAHIHMTLMREDFDEYWIDATWFEGDRIITKELTQKLTRVGGFSNIVELSKNESGLWAGKRDIILNPPN